MTRLRQQAATLHLMKPGNLAAAILAFSLISSHALAGSSESCAESSGWVRLEDDGRLLMARVVGDGPPVLVIPSLGRGPADFDELSNSLVRSGYSVVSYEPRWFGESRGPEDADLFDLASDSATVLDRLCPGTKAVVVGHAFGNRVARTLASARPEIVESLVLLAAGGQKEIPPQISAAIAGAAAQGERTDEERLADLRVAFFAKGNDARVWLEGWSPAAARLQAATTGRTTLDWRTGGGAEILIVQAAEDPVAPPSNADALKALGGSRVTVVTLPNASHAMLPEQPAALGAVILAFLAKERSEANLQVLIDTAVRLSAAEAEPPE